MLTCKHLFEKGVGNITLELPDRRKLTGKLLAQDPDNDLAAVVCDAPDDMPLTAVSSEPARIHEKLWKVGYPGGQGPVNGEGRCTGGITEKWMLAKGLRTALGDLGGAGLTTLFLR